MIIFKEEQLERFASKKLEEILEKAQYEKLLWEQDYDQYFEEDDYCISSDSPWDDYIALVRKILMERDEPVPYKKALRKV